MINFILTNGAPPDKEIKNNRRINNSIESEIPNKTEMLILFLIPLPLMKYFIKKAKEEQKKKRRR